MNENIQYGIRSLFHPLFIIAELDLNLWNIPLLKKNHAIKQKRKGIKRVLNSKPVAALTCNTIIQTIRMPATRSKFVFLFIIMIS